MAGESPGATRAALVEVVREIHATRCPDAPVILAAGSLIRGEGTASSDLDLVVVYPSLANAWRESFRFAGYPVEAFVHDPGTLEYFFTEDRASGVPALAQMVFEGVEVPTSHALSRAAKARAGSILAAGPPPLDAAHEARLRYGVSDSLDDARAPRTGDELMAIGARLYEQLADYHLRRLGRWSARAKGIPRALRALDPDLAARYADAFTRLFAHGDATPVIRLAEDLLAPAGGPLFDGYRQDAPAGSKSPV
jgi:hypothetical protein